MIRFDPVPELKRQAGEELARLTAAWKGPELTAWLGTDAPRVNDLKRGKLDRFSLETLVRYVSKLRRVPKLVFEDRPPIRAKSR